MRSALVNETINIVENICVAEPVTPSPYTGYLMVGLQEPVYETQTITNNTTHPVGTTFTVNQDGTVTVTLPSGTVEQYPAGTTVTQNGDGTVTTVYTVTEEILVNPGTACDIGWIYDPATGTFSAP